MHKNTKKQNEFKAKATKKSIVAAPQAPQVPQPQAIEPISIPMGSVVIRVTGQGVTAETKETPIAAAATKPGHNITLETNGHHVDDSDEVARQKKLEGSITLGTNQEFESSSEKSMDEEDQNQLRENSSSSRNWIPSFQKKRNKKGPIRFRCNDDDQLNKTLEKAQKRAIFKIDKIANQRLKLEELQNSYECEHSLVGSKRAAQCSTTDFDSETLCSKSNLKRTCSEYSQRHQTLQRKSMEYLSETDFDKNLKKPCLDFIEEFMDKPFAMICVIPIERDNPHYQRLVDKNEMKTFKEIKEQLETGEITSMKEFEQKMRRIIGNCYINFVSKPDIQKKVKDLSATFENMLHALYEKLLYQSDKVTSIEKQLKRVDMELPSQLNCKQLNTKVNNYADLFNNVNTQLDKALEDIFPGSTKTAEKAPAEEAEEVKVEKVEKVEKVKKVQKAPKVEKLPKAEKAPKTQKIEKIQKVEKVEKTENAEKVQQVPSVEAEQIQQVHQVEVEKVQQVETVQQVEKIEKVQQAEKVQEVKKMEKVEEKKTVVAAPKTPKRRGRPPKLTTAEPKASDLKRRIQIANEINGLESPKKNLVMEFLYSKELLNLKNPKDQENIVVDLDKIPDGTFKELTKLITNLTKIPKKPKIKEKKGTETPKFPFPAYDTLHGNKGKAKPKSKPKESQIKSLPSIENLWSTSLKNLGNSKLLPPINESKEVLNDSSSSATNSVDISKAFLQFQPQTPVTPAPPVLATKSPSPKFLRHQSVQPLSSPKNQAHKYLLHQSLSPPRQQLSTFPQAPNFQDSPVALQTLSQPYAQPPQRQVSSQAISQLQQSSVQPQAIPAPQTQTQAQSQSSMVMQVMVNQQGQPMQWQYMQSPQSMPPPAEQPPTPAVTTQLPPAYQYTQMSSHIPGHVPASYQQDTTAPQPPQQQLPQLSQVKENTNNSADLSAGFNMGFDQRKKYDNRYFMDDNQSSLAMPQMMQPQQPMLPQLQSMNLMLPAQTHSGQEIQLPPASQVLPLSYYSSDTQQPQQVYNNGAPFYNMPGR